MEGDLEEGQAQIEEERCISVSSKLMDNNYVWMENKMVRALPGFYYEDGGRPYAPLLPLKIAMASYPAEKQTSSHSVAFAVPLSPYVTSL